MNKLLHMDSCFDDIYNRNVDTVYRVCYMYMKNKYDTEDMVQTTFLKFLKSNPLFENRNHEKAWFIVTASNTCKNHFFSWHFKNIENKEIEIADKQNNDEVLEAVQSLSNKYKTVIYLYYYEGYNTAEISKLLNINESTIRTHLLKGRRYLQKILGSEGL